MKRQNRHSPKTLKIWLCLLIWLLPVGALYAESLPLDDPAANIPPPQSSAPTQKPKIVQLGEGQYAIGAIRVDQKTGILQVPGKVIRITPPLEFLAVTKGGLKAYESLLELESDAFEFNLACIMLGLDAKNANSSDHHFDPRLVEGDPVEVWVSWQQDGKTIRMAGAQILGGKGAESASDEWIYTGSSFAPNGKYMAATDGTLVGFVHDPASIIEHKQGLGLGDYGAVGDANNNVAPPVGTPVTLSILKAQ